MQITLLPGDGIGPEIINALKAVLGATGLNLSWNEMELGQKAIDKGKKPLPDEVIESLKRNKVGIKGPVTTFVGRGFRSVNVGLRQNLDLYASVRPVRTRKGVRSRYTDIDLVIIRENTEDLYSGIEYSISSDIAQSVKVITRFASERICRYAFEYAVKHKRNKVTAVHKANIMKRSDGLFLEVFRDVARNYPNIEAKEEIVDALCMNLVMKPEFYDVLVLPNLYGDIVSDLCAGLVGGLGVVPGANIGENVALFEAVHGSALDIAGRGIANPMGIFLSACMMLHHIGFREEAILIEEAVEQVLSEDKMIPFDLGGMARTEEFTNEVIKKM